MLTDLFPRAHARFSSLPLLGPQLDGLARWLGAQGFSASAIQQRIRKAPTLEVLLQGCGVGSPCKLSRAELMALAPRKSCDDRYLSALVRSLTACLGERGALEETLATPSQHLVDAYQDHLGQVRGLAESTVKQHASTALELLAFLHFDHAPGALRALAPPRIEAFVKSVAKRRCHVSLQSTASHLRSFLRFLAGRGEAPTGLDAFIDMPRVYRGERLPRALPWETVQALLAKVDRTTEAGRRDYAMLLIMATYGLRSSEVAALRLDDIGWRVGEFRVQRPKALAPIILPLTREVGAALLDYLRNARPRTACREVFLRIRHPLAPLSRTGVRGAFLSWRRRSTLDIPFAGPHCLRHSLALHLLRRNTPLKVIGDLLGHRCIQSTCTYLRLHEEDLRAAALDLPTGKEVGR